MTTPYGRTARILIAIETGAVTPPQIARQLGVSTASIRESLFSLRRTGRIMRMDDGEWTTLPSPDSAQILGVLSLIESENRRWIITELAGSGDLTIGQVVAITDVLASAGLIERIGAGSYRCVAPFAQRGH